MTGKIKERIKKTNKGNIPQGYTWLWHLMPLEWADVPLSHILLKKNAKNKGNIVDTVFTNSATAGIILQTEYFEKDIAHSESTGEYYVVAPGDYVYNPRISENAPYGPFKRNDTGTTGIVSPLYTVFAPKREYEGSEFLRYYLESAQWYKYAYSIANYGARFDRMNITDQELMRLPVAWPSLPEQQKIGEILSRCDEVIELYRCELQEIKKLKKACLQKLFPQHGSKNPEVRFPGFNTPWEQRKFSEITFPSGVRNRDNLPLESYSITNENGFVPQDEKFENGGTMREADKRMYYIVSPCSFAYNPARINVGSIGYQNLNKNVIVSSLYEVFQTTDEIDDRFLWHWFKTSGFQKLIEQLQEGGVRLYFYYDKLCMGTLSFPSLEEQRKIGQYLDALDHLITLHLHKLGEMERMKKALMQLLLAGIVRVNSK